MKRILGLLLALIASPIIGQAQTVTATITDSPDGTAWASLNGFNATYTITLVTSGGVPVPSGQAYRADTGATVTNPAGGNLDATGTFTATVVSNSNIKPAGTQWQFGFCSATTSRNCYVVTMPINASGTYSTQLSVGAVSPRVNGGVGVFAYTDTEVATTPNNSYYNITTPACRYYGGSWGNCGSGAGGSVTAVTGTAPIVSSGGSTPALSCPTCNTSSATVTSVSVTTANGVSGTVATPTTTPAISLTLGAINPSSTGATTAGTGAFTTLNSDLALDVNSYSGATLDVKWNACNTAAIALGGAVCDARSLGGSQTVSAAMKCGNTSSVPVKFLLPAAGTWTVSTQASSSDYDIDYFPGCVIEGNSAQPTGLFVTHTAANGTSLGVLGPGPGVTPAYVNIGGFSLALNSTAVITNAAMVIAGADNTVFHDMAIDHFSGGATGITTNGTNGTGICCSATLRNITVNGQFSGGINLDLEATSTLVLQGLVLDHISLGHSTSPYPNFKCASTGAANTSVNFHDLYEETNKNYNTSTMNQISVCSNVLFDGFTPNDIGGSSTTTMISTTNTFNSGVVITNFNPVNFNYGAVIVNNGYTGISTTFSAICCGSYFTNPFEGVATAQYFLANGTAPADSTAFFGVATGIANGNAPYIRWGASASSSSGDMNESLYSGNLCYNNHAANIFCIAQSTGNVTGPSGSTTLSGWGTISAGTKLTAPAITATALVTGGTNTQRLTSDSSGITATTPGTAEWTWSGLVASTNYSFHCAILYSQATGAGGVGFSVQSATTAATRLDAWANIFTSNAGVQVEGSALDITNTTATSIVSGTPAATATVYQATIDGTIQTASTAGTLNVLAYTGNASDAVTIKAGSYCAIHP